MQVMWWEWLEVEEHCNRYPSLWRPVGYDAWARIDDGVLAFVIQPVKSTNTESQYRQTTITYKCRTWSEQQVSEYMLTVLMKHTMFGARMEYEATLRDELHLTDQLATVAAIVGAYVFLQGPANTPFGYLLTNAGVDERATVNTMKREEGDLDESTS